MADEARAMLDALMGGDRNAPLPAGAAVKRSAEAPLLLPAKRRKSCYDGDICPLYCAWNGVDVYELFVNTKSDLGPNPKLPNDAAAQEFQQLPKHEQDRLGFKGLLFRKLQDLCRQCDRTVARNKEKLVQERRQKATSQNFVQEVDERALEQVCRAKIHEQYIKEELENKVRELDRVLQEERQLRELYEEETKKTASEEEEEVKKETEQDEEKGGEEAGTKGAPGEAGESKEVEEEDKEEKEDKSEEEKKTADEDTSGISAEDKPTEADANNDVAPQDSTGDTVKKDGDDKQVPSELQQEMHTLLLKRQKLLFDLARTMQQYAPLQQSIDSQMEQLHLVKSDITSDKTVCEVSGNFMSARDADERIAAHYAGKQYVGWKLVRDKLQEMIKEYGRYGPPLPERGGDPSYGRGRDGGGGDRYGRSGSGDRYRREGQRSSSPQRWERGGGGSRGHGGGDWRRGGGGGRDYRGNWRR